MVPVDRLKVIFNPSFPYRLAHMTIAAYLATALFVGAEGSERPNAAAPPALQHASRQFPVTTASAMEYAVSETGKMAAYGTELTI